MFDQWWMRVVVALESATSYRSTSRPRVYLEKHRMNICVLDVILWARRGCLLFAYMPQRSINMSGVR